MAWGDEKTIQFIHLYREYECLWKPSSPLYKNKIARSNAYSKIQDELNLTEKEIKNKIKSLRSTYHQEKKKVENSIRSGAGSSDIYKPNLIWFKEMDFLNESFDYRNSIQAAVIQESSRSSTETETPPSHSQRQSESVQQSDQQSSSQTVQQSDQQSSSQTVQQSDQQSSSQTINPPNNERSHSSEASTNIQAPSHQDQRSSSRTAAIKKKKRVEQNETLTALERLEKIATTINNPGSNEKQKDEFYYFGQSVAAQLRSFPLNNALDMQSKIQVLLSTERSRLSTSYSQPFTPYPNTSIYSEEIAASVDDQFIIIPTQSNTGQESGDNIFSQAWNNA